MDDLIYNIVSQSEIKSTKPRKNTGFKVSDKTLNLWKKQFPWLLVTGQHRNLNDMTFSESAVDCKDITGGKSQGSTCTGKEQLIVSGGKVLRNIQNTDTLAKPPMDVSPVDIDNEDDDVLSVESFDACLYQEIVENDVEIPSGRKSQIESCEFKPASPEENKVILGNDLEYVNNKIDNTPKKDVQLEIVEGSLVKIGGESDCMNVAENEADFTGAEMGLFDIRSLNIEANTHADGGLQNVATDINPCVSKYIRPQLTVCPLMNIKKIFNNKTKSPLSVEGSKHTMHNSIRKDSPSKLESVEERTCNVCKKVSRSKMELFEHASVHTQEKRFLCYKCKYRFIARKTFVDHFRKCKPTSTELHYSCYKCNALFKHQNTFYVHFSACSDVDDSTKIDEISKPIERGDTVQGSEIHKEPPIHQNEPLEESSATVFSCEQCGKLFRLQVQKNFHLRKCTRLTSSTQLSQKLMRKKTSQQQGQEVHHEERTCDCCKKIWKRPGEMKCHMFSKMLISLSPERQQALTEEINATICRNTTCRKCGKRFIKRRSLRRHIVIQHIAIKHGTQLTMFNELVPSKKSKLASEVMNKTTVFKSKHVSGKSTEDRRTCSCCNKVWRRPYEMKQHMLKKKRSTKLANQRTQKMNTHITDSNTCSYCGKVFSSVHNMRRHLLTHKDKFTGTPTKSHSVKGTSPSSSNVAGMETTINKNRISLVGQKVCTCCNKKWVAPSKLKRHMLSKKFQSTENNVQNIQDDKTRNMINENNPGLQESRNKKLKKKSGMKKKKKIVAKKHSTTASSLKDNSREKVLQQVSIRNVKNMDPDVLQKTCPVCRKIFAYKKSVPKHLKFHQRMNHYKCMVCHTILKTFDQWEKHTTEHRIAEQTEQSNLVDMVEKDETGEVEIKLEVNDDLGYVVESYNVSSGVVDEHAPDSTLVTNMNNSDLESEKSVGEI